MTIGYIGLGSMGGALARRLQLRHALSVFDKREETIKPLVAQGAEQAHSLVDLAARCETIFLCLPTSDHVHSVIFDEDGLLGAARAGTVIVDQSTGDPGKTRKMARELEARGIQLIDAPVSGGPTAADAGTIAIMVGASGSQIEQIRPTLECISSSVFHAGEVGAGQVAKLANNFVSAAQRLVTMEAMALAVKNGVDSETIVDIMTAGAAKNFYLERLVRPHVLSGKLASGFTLGLLHKDIKLACQLGTESDVTMLFGNLTREFLQMTINENSPDTQVYAMALMMDRLAGTHVVPTSHTLD
jgi:3-hydroxyisobutyrate dehydrogenase